MNRSTKLIMPYDLRFWILMFENRQQVEQRKTLRLCSRICRTTFFIQSAFIADSNTMPVISELAVSSNTLRGIRRGEDMCIYQYVRVIRCMTEYLNLIIRMDMLLKELRTVLASNCDLVVATVPHRFHGICQPKEWVVDRKSVV